MDNLVINKTLKNNLPDTTQGNEIYFTEDGGIYINDNNGKIRQAGIDDELKNKIDSLSQGGGNITNTTVQVENATIMGTSLNNKDNALIAWYDFDTFDGTKSYLEDKTQNLNHSQPITLGPTFEIDSTLNRKVAVFNGTSQFIPLGTVFKINHLSATFLVYKDNWGEGTKYKFISCAQTGGYNLGFNEANYALGIVYINGAYQTVTSINPLDSLSSGWHTFTIDFDGYKISLFIDGKLNNYVEYGANGTRYNTSYHTSNGVFLCAEAYTNTTTPESSYYFKGKLAEVRIYNRGLTEKEVAEVHNEMINHRPVLYDIPITVNGDYIQKIEINDLTNPLTTIPLEYGYFKVSSNQTNIDELNIIPFDTIESGNMETPINGVFKLKQGITYEIDFDMYSVFSNNYSCRIECYNIDTNEWLIRGGKAPSTCSQNITSTVLKGIITPEKDINIGFRTSAIISTLHSEYTFVMIKEIRNNPVNQYGGFETEVLFDGMATDVNAYELSDNVDNYNLLIIENDFGPEDDPSKNNIVPTMTSNTTPAPYVVTASADGTNAYKVFDNTGVNTSKSVWYAKANFPQSITIDMGAPTKINAFSITNGNSVGNYHSYPPKDITFEGSNDGSVFIEIGNYTFDQLVSDEEVMKTLTATVSFRFYRWTVTSGYHASYVIIAEIKLFNIDNTLEIKRKVSTSLIALNKNNNHYLFFDDKSMVVGFENNKMTITNNINAGITKVIGVKGQLPSLLVGGEF